MSLGAPRSQLAHPPRGSRRATGRLIAQTRDCQVRGVSAALRGVCHTLFVSSQYLHLIFHPDSRENMADVTNSIQLRKLSFLSFDECQLFPCDEG